MSCCLRGLPAAWWCRGDCWCSLSSAWSPRPRSLHQPVVRWQGGLSGTDSGFATVCYGLCSVCLCMLTGMRRCGFLRRRCRLRHFYSHRTHLPQTAAFSRISATAFCSALRWWRFFVWRTDRTITGCSTAMAAYFTRWRAPGCIWRWCLAQRLQSSMES